MADPIDYEGVLADLVAKRDKLNAAISGIRLMLGGGGSEEGDQVGTEDETENESGPRPALTPRPLRQALGNTAIRNDTFFGLSTPEAIRKYLMMMKRPQRVADISKAMIDGGQIHARDTTTAYNNVYAALKRMRKSGDGVRIKSGEWALAEWYSNKPKGDNE